MLIFNEEKYAQLLYHGLCPDVRSVTAKIGYVTRYLFHVCQYSDQEIYQRTVEWMISNHNNFDESCYSNLISDAIKKAKKKPFFHIDNIVITKKELDSISSLNDLRSEKVLFVLLCMAKHQRLVYGFTNGLVKYSLPTLCKEARISVPTDDREYILYNIMQNGLLESPKKNDTSCLMINFIDENDEPVIVIDEIDCQELAYVYLNWKNSGNGYARCEFCGRIMKQGKKTKHRFCKHCTEIVGEVADDMRVFSCIDCGELVYVPLVNSASCRCHKCQLENRKNTYNKYNAKRRIKNDA